jgi:hypothetical protein
VKTISPIQFFSRPGLRGRRFYFRVRDPDNHEILCASEGYNSREARKDGFFQLVDTIVRLSGAVPTPGRAIPITDMDLERS